MATMRSQKMLMECTVCMAREMVALHELDRDALRANDSLSRHCKHCLQDTLWQIASHTRNVDSGSTHNAPTTGYGAIPCETNSQQRDRRKQRRAKMKMTACIRARGSEDVVTVLDASRHGIRFQSSKQYALNTWVQVAVPYMGGTSNIFMSSRIVWRKSITAGLQEYGLRYDQ